MQSRWGKIAWQTVRAVAFHPSLWGIAILTTIRFAKNGWWKKWPFLPLPGEAYWRFRMETVYGDPEAVPSLDDVRAFLGWCRRS